MSCRVKQVTQTTTASEKEAKESKKKLLTNGWHYDIVNKLSPRDDNDE